MIIVTGCGRSGTSAVARILHTSGLSVGRDLIEADAGNAEGYFEERPVIALNEHILLAAGLHEPFANPSRADVLAASAPYGDEMRQLAAAATPAWKDPRFCWTLEAWLDALPQAPRIIVCLRSPSEVVASTLAYYGQAGDAPASAIEHTWRSEYERLLEVIDEYRLNAISIEFGELHRDPPAAVKGLERFLDRPLGVSGVRADLRHHAVPIPARFAALYEQVRSLGHRWRVPGQAAAAP
jgi:hypothetical protein